jgi:hypothetical protein
MSKRNPFRQLPSVESLSFFDRKWVNPTLTVVLLLQIVILGFSIWKTDQITYYVLNLPRTIKAYLYRNDLPHHHPSPKPRPSIMMINIRNESVILLSFPRLDHLYS